MKNFKRKAIPAIFMLLMAIISLTGVTFAWFSDAKEAEVKNININITESSGVAISTNATGEYAKYVDLSDSASETLSPVSAYVEKKNLYNTYKLVSPAPTADTYTAGTYYVKNASGAFVKEEATSAFSSTAKYYEIEQAAATVAPTDLVFYETSKGNGAGKISNITQYSDSTDKGYIKFELFFETLSKAKDVFFNTTKGFNITANTSSEKGNDTYQARSAVRIAFVVYETVASKTAKEGYTTVQRTIIIEPYKTEHVTTRSLIGDAATAVEDYYGLCGAYTLSEHENVELDQTPDANSEYMKKVTTDTVAAHSLVNTATEKGTTEELFTIGQGYTRVDMYIWLEGQDLDCIDAITLEDVVLNFSFFCLDSTVNK